MNMVTLVYFHESRRSGDGKTPQLPKCVLKMVSNKENLLFLWESFLDTSVHDC